MAPTIRETERNLRSAGYSRREAEEMAAALHTKKNEAHKMSKTLLETRKEELSKLEDAFERVKWIKGRNDEQEQLYCELAAGIPAIREDIAILEGRVAAPGRPLTGAPLSLIGPGGGRFAVKAGDTVLPVYAMGDRMVDHYPRPQNEEGDWLARKVRAALGLTNPGDIKAAVGSGPETVPTYVGAEIIDDVRARTVVVRAGAGTINILGPTNLAKITADPTVYQHTEATADISESAPTLAAVELDPKALVAAIPLPFEVVADAPPGHLDKIIRTSVGAAFALKLDLLSIATLLADSNIPKDTVAHDPNAWANVLASVGAAMAANQDLPTAWIGNTADFIARATEQASTAGSWLGKPPALANMVEYPTTSISAGFAFLGGFEQGFAIAVRQDLRIEVIRFQKTTSAQHVLMCTARMDGVVLQPKRLFKCLKTIV